MVYMTLAVQELGDAASGVLADIEAAFISSDRG
jgi:hypothetical protein